MGELLRLFGADKGSSSRAFWLGTSRIIDSRPVLSGDVADAVADGLVADEVGEADDWSTVADELREAIAVVDTK